MRFSDAILHEIRTTRNIHSPIVDAYGESEQMVGFYTMIEDNLSMPIETEMFGVKVKADAAAGAASQPTNPSPPAKVANPDSYAAAALESVKNQPLADGLNPAIMGVAGLILSKVNIMPLIRSAGSSDRGKASEKPRPICPIGRSAPNHLVLGRKRF